MKYKSILKKEISANVMSKAKLIYFGFVLILAFIFVGGNSMKVKAETTTEVISTMFDKNNDGEITEEEVKDADGNVTKKSETFSKVNLESGTSKLTFVQGNGKDDKVAIKFNIYDFPSTATSIMIVESERTDSSATADADRYSKVVDEDDGTISWVASSKNQTKNGIIGKVIFTESEGKINVEVVYRIRRGAFGLNFIKIFYYSANAIETDPSGSVDVSFVIAQPIDMLNQSSDNCSSKSETEICIDYAADDPTSRISRELKVYIPSSVAYRHNLVALTSAYDATIKNNVVTNGSAVMSDSTIYAINYFNEDNSGEVSAPSITDIASAGRIYMYTNISLIAGEKSGDSIKQTQVYFDSRANGGYNGNYTIAIANNFTANTISYFATKVDSIGTYVYYIKDIFGNMSQEIHQRVTNVKNRGIITEVEKGNATVEGTKGFDAEEKYTNESVAIKLTMTVETHFEFGVCNDSTKCTKVIALTPEEVKQVKYWRVDVVTEIKDGNLYDKDAYEVGKTSSDVYASESHAAEDSKFILYCKSGYSCSGTTQNYNDSDKYLETGAGIASFGSGSNVLTMYVGVNGRYRFNIIDVYDNDSKDVEEEYRNPRVEIYGIDKKAPEITFEHDDVDADSNLKTFDLETYEYYQGISLDPNEDGDFIKVATVSGTEAVARSISGEIYYPINRDSGTAGDKVFTDLLATVLSKVRVSEYVYYYNGSKDKFADYSLYDRVEGDKYVLKASYGESGNATYDNSIVTILSNVKNNSNGLKLTSGEFVFNDIKYYHSDGTTEICVQITEETGYTGYTDEMTCVNYYIDHGVDFIIEFIAEDSVGNVGSEKVYVNLVDTTPPGFTLHYKEGTTNYDDTKYIKATNVGTDCRMEIGQEIGKGKVQNKDTMLQCFNVNIGGASYNFEDNVYDSTVKSGLLFANTVGNTSHVKLYVRSDVSGEYIDLEEGTFIPNKTGYYDFKIVIKDAAGNELIIENSYYVDRKIVLIAPFATAVGEDDDKIYYGASKVYGQADPTFHYCVYIDINNNYDIRFSENPYSDPDIYSKIYCTNDGASDVSNGEAKLFQGNTNSTFSGALSRLESEWYNRKIASPNLIEGTDPGVGVENNYVGDAYRFILGTLNIKLKSDGETEDSDYIVKIHPYYREDTIYNGTVDGNKITKNPLEDDSPFSQSNVRFTIKQAVINVSANGGSKNYGELDTNHNSYNNDSATNKYLNGFNPEVDGLFNDGLQYNDDTSIILGVLRRKIGENVGKYKICNYRGIGNNDNVLETKVGSRNNNMYLDCDDETNSDISFNNDYDDYTGYTYLDNGVLNINADYIKSRALYIKTNKQVAGKTLNVTTEDRNNNYANYVINYSEGYYIINAIDLVLQAAPGQRREYNYTNTYDPNPWEIILYGLVDSLIVRETEVENTVVAFNGYTEDGSVYTANPNEKDTAGGSAASKVAANASEERSEWKLYHNNNQLTGLKTNETYTLLRSADNGKVAGSAELNREEGKSGGWYLYQTLQDDLNVVSGTSSSVKSKIAVVTNGNEHCGYDVTGHIVSVSGNSPCKNYNLVYNPYYTNADGYTIETKLPIHTADEGGIYQQFVYKSNGKTCLTLDPDVPCKNTATEPQQIYKIQFEVYRREVILEFNSAIETIRLSNTETYDIFYGKRYNFYNTKYLDINFYDTYNAETTNTTKLYPENYLFLCYQNETTMARAEFDPAQASSTGCSGDPSYGLTAGDTWVNIGIKFWMHSAVSATDSNYYDDADYAIPAGVYYIYADIAEGQKVNYNFKYLGGRMTIKSKAVDINITSYVKEYGEKYYNKYGTGTTYSEINSSFTNLCMVDGLFLNGETSLVTLLDGENNPIYCVDANTDLGNTNQNVYGFFITGLDDKDTIKDNFTGRPSRARNGSKDDDFNGLQDNVGTYTFTKGSIATIHNNNLASCNMDVNTLLPSGEGCVVVSGKQINNYVIKGETRMYVFDMHTTENEESDVDVSTPNMVVTEGKLFITPATITITVEAGQKKMYGCAYNKFNNATATYMYEYENGYGDTCVETDDDYYDLGYKYTVSGDKDYQIAKTGYDVTYSNDEKYVVDGIYGTSTFRPNGEGMKGSKWHGLNNGTLFRIPYTADEFKMSSYVDAAIKAQTVVAGESSKTYQRQTVGTYLLTLGNVDAPSNEARDGTAYINSCNENNIPDASGTYECKNYNISYHGYNTSTDEKLSYENEESLKFNITKRSAYVYTKYDYKIYGTVDLYRDPTTSAVYLCGDYNMDGVVNDSDKIDGVNGDVYNGFCSQAQVDVNSDVDTSNDVKIDYGLTRYYTKYNSLAKYPWNGIEGRNDVQTDVITGKISRKGMNGNAPHTDDVKGLYDYVYEIDDFYGSVHLIGAAAATDSGSYGNDNYDVVYYKDGKTVNEKGETVEEDAEGHPVKYEIVLRKIKIGLISFNKVYGEKDDVKDYDVLVCAPTEDFDFVNKKCINRDPNDEHGLSDTHIETYLIEGLLNQEKFKEEFVVRFLRVLGENVSCGTSTNVNVSLTGSFAKLGEGDTATINAEGTLYTNTLKCNTTIVEDKSVYETLAYVDQSDTTMPGYNYQVSYKVGYVNIVPRPILITPDSNQGFMYGDYHGTLIPAITYKDSLVKTAGDGIIQTYGLVHDTTANSSDGVCLNNINYYNNGTINGSTIGTCFYINDRIDEYDSASNMNTSSYDASKINSNTGLSSVSVKNFVFGDVYQSESSSRSALSKELSGSEARYNRNVGIYIITKGDLKDLTGNYTISFTENVAYEITYATVTITPDSVSKEKSTFGTSQTNQYKIYGEQDKELTFTVLTTYKVRQSHYAKYSSNIVKITSESGTEKLLASLDRFNYDSDSKTFVRNDEGEYIALVTNDIVTLSGFAYNENSETSVEYASESNPIVNNYGKGQHGLKKGTEQSLSQASIADSMYYDIACKGKDTNECDSETKKLTYTTTSRILLGYLHVENYAQSTGEYKIVSGLQVANNEWGNKNYGINFIENVKFTIIPRPIGIRIENVVKTYGQTTDVLSCENVAAGCSVDTGVLTNGNSYLKYNFTTETVNPDDIKKVASNDNDSLLYTQNNHFANGMVSEAQKAYSSYLVSEDKNSQHLGVYVSRDERNVTNSACLYSGDRFGFCEDSGVYSLRLYGYLQTIDSITADGYNSVYKPTTTISVNGVNASGLVESVAKYYYNSYFGYNPNYFVVVIDNDNDKSVVVPSEIFANSYPSTSRSTTNTKDFEKILKSTGTLTINKKSVALYVNTAYFEDGAEIYNIGQNTNPPELPVINNFIDLNYNQFNGLGSYNGNLSREEAVKGKDSYGNVIWGTHPNKVRVGDKLVGALAYCNNIIAGSTYEELLASGLTSDYVCAKELVYNEERNSVSTNLKEGYIPIVRDSSKLGIVSVASDVVNTNYENNNYSVRFYPGRLYIAEDAVKPVVEVNRDHVYIEANAIGKYIYECVGANKTTTYTNCSIEGASIWGKTELSEGDPILDWLNDSSNASIVIKGSLPVAESCNDLGTGGCRSSKFFELNYGKSSDIYEDRGGIVDGTEAGFVYPFSLNDSDSIKNEGPNSVKQFINTLVSWFGVTSYDQGEIRGEQYLDKKFNKYWYLIIEEMGTNGTFDISKVGEYKIHFYVMDNAGNVSEGNMYNEGVLETTYKNTGTLHIIDTTNPVVGTLNLYNARVECNEDDCTIENNWVAANDTYLPLITMYKYDSEGNPSANGGYIDIGAPSLVSISSIDKYSRTVNNLGEIIYSKDNAQGKYVLVPKGNNARALKHYSWNNSQSGIYLTITGGSDNSYTVNSFPTKNVTDWSQWNHYYSRDDGITWFLFNKSAGSSYLALDSEGTREILIKAVDSGVSINSATNSTSTYTVKYYGVGASANTTDTMNKYIFADTVKYDDDIKEFESMTTEEQAANEEFRKNALNGVGWNVSDAATNNTSLADNISMLIYGKVASGEGGSNYKFFKDRRTAYLDRTSPVISFGENNGEDMYVYEFGCESCTIGYKEHFANAKDDYPLNYTSSELKSDAFNKNHSIVINKFLFPDVTTDYTDITQEKPGVISSFGGLGSDAYAMNGLVLGLDIRSVYVEERRYIIYSFDESDTRTVYDLSSSIPTTIDTTDEGYSESSIYNIIKNPSMYNEDYTYTIIYSVFDKAGNESVYISRGVIYVDLVPNIDVVPGGGTPEVDPDDEPAVVEQISENEYSMTVEQGDDLQKVLNSFSVDASLNKQFLTQTIYYNGELVVEEGRYQKNIYDGFTTSAPGIYEITYNLQYMHVGDNGVKELIEAKPVKLTITIEATAPIVNSEVSVDYSYIIMAVSILIASLALCLFSFVSKKKN